MRQGTEAGLQCLPSHLWLCGPNRQTPLPSRAGKGCAARGWVGGPAVHVLGDRGVGDGLGGGLQAALAAQAAAVAAEAV